MESEKTLYMYVYRMIVNDIYNEKYGYDDKLPSLIEICQSYSVGRNTVRNALGKLQEDGFIRLEKGVKARVIFNVRDFDSNYQYRLTLLNCRQMTSDIYTALGIFLPEIGSVCLHKATKEQLEHLIYLTKTINNDTNVQKREMINQLFRVYLYGFGLLENPVLLDLIITLLYSVNPPLSKEKLDDEKTRSHFKVIQKTLSSLFPLAIKGNDFMIRKSIAMLCSMYKKVSLAYNDRVCENMTPTQDSQFMWVSNRSQEFLYAQVLLAIFNDIREGIYDKDSLFPSIQKISETYDVSMRTSRKVISLLNKYHIIETINGFGSRIILNKEQAICSIYENPEIIDKLQTYYYSQQLLNLLANSVLSATLKQLDLATLQKVADHLAESDSFTLEYLHDYIFSLSNACLQGIYNELKRALGWRILIDSLVDYEHCDFDFVGTRDKLILELKRKKTLKITNYVKEIGEANLALTKQIIDQYSN